MLRIIKIFFCRAPAPHVDIHQDDQERQKFKEKYGVPDFYGSDKLEPNVLNGDFDTDDEKLGVILGLWKPLSPHEVWRKIEFGLKYAPKF